MTDRKQALIKKNKSPLQDFDKDGALPQQSKTTDGEKSSPSPSGPEVIKSYLKTLGSSPGVYRMFDKDGTVLYVGKACNLKNRVQKLHTLEWSF